MAHDEKADDEGSGKGALVLVRAGQPYIGPTAVAAISTLAGPLSTLGGALTGGFIGDVMRRVGDALERRELERSQHARVGGAFATAVVRIDERLRTSDELRDDGFFDVQRD